MSQSAYDKALYLLSSREHTERELHTKLLQKGYGEEDVENAVVRLKKEGALSEERFAEVFIRSRLRKSAEGRSLLSLRLQEKGTPRTVAQAALEEAWENEVYLEPLREAYHDYARKKGTEYARGKLMQKGFTLSEIRRVEERDDD